MKRKEFLERIEAIWNEHGEWQDPLTIEDLLDDCAMMGMEGASEAYFFVLRDGSVVKDINAETGTC